MVILELNKLRPLDILLTSGDRKFSRVIRACTTLARAGRRAHFSHASVLISPTVVLESLDVEGIVFTNLIEPDMSSRQGEQGEQGERDNLLIGRRGLLPFLNDGQLRLFVELEGVAGAAVYRHEQFWPTPTYLLTENIRPVVLEAAVDWYLAQYPGIGRLLRTIPGVPKRIQETIERLSESLESKVLSGPFCSELVMLVFFALEEYFHTTIATPEHALPAPADYAASDDFKIVPAAVLEGSREELPGVPCDDQFRAQLERMLTSEALRHQTLNSKILELGSRSAHLLKAFGESADWESFYSNLRDEDRRKWLGDIAEFLKIGCDPFWQWVTEADKCRQTCPEGRHRKGQTVSTEPAKEMSFSEMFNTPSYMWPRYGYWDGSACKDVRGCVCASTTWERLVRHFEEATEARRSALFQSMQAELGIE